MKPLLKIAGLFVVIVSLFLVATNPAYAEVTTLSELKVGDRVIDPSWEWEHRLGVNYSATGCTKPVTWIVVAKEHPGTLDNRVAPRTSDAFPGIAYPRDAVTLLAEEVIAIGAFDNSTNRGTQYGNNVWAMSGQPNATFGVSTFLNTTFYNSFSDSFKNAVHFTRILTMHGSLREPLVTPHWVFLLSQEELGAGSLNTTPIGMVMPYFAHSASVRRKAVFFNREWPYWTISPANGPVEDWIRLQYDYFARYVKADGNVDNIKVDTNHIGLRPAVNLKGSTPVRSTGVDGIYEIVWPFPPPAGWNANHRLGPADVASGAYVQLGGKLWRVIGDNYLALWQSEPTRRAYAASGSSDYARSDVRSYLNSQFFSGLGDQKHYVAKTLWNVGGAHNPQEKWVYDRVGLLSAAESGPVFAIPDFKDIAAGTWEWLRTPHSFQAGKVLVMALEGAHQLKSADERGGAVRPAVVLKPGLLIQSGAGTSANPYQLTDTANVPVERVSISQNSISLYLARTEQLRVTVHPAGATNKRVTWHSTNPAVARVDQNGLVSAVGLGSTTVSAVTEDGAKRASCTVSVRSLPDLENQISKLPDLNLDLNIRVPLNLPDFSNSGSEQPHVPVAGLTLNKMQSTLEIGASEALAATVIPANATNRTVAWFSSNPAVAAVNAGGTVTAVFEGTAVITALNADRSGVFTAECQITVKAGNVAVTGVTLDRQSLSLEAGQKQHLSASIFPAGATNQGLAWSSSNTAVAAVSATGEVSAVSPGDACITVTTADGNFSTNCNVTVLEEGLSAQQLLLDNENLTNLPADSDSKGALNSKTLLYILLSLTASALIVTLVVLVILIRKRAR